MLYGFQEKAHVVFDEKCMRFAKSYLSLSFAHRVFRSQSPYASEGKIDVLDKKNMFFAKCSLSLSFCCENQILENTPGPQT